MHSPLNSFDIKIKTCAYELRRFMPISKDTGVCWDEGGVVKTPKWLLSAALQMTKAQI